MPVDDEHLLGPQTARHLGDDRNQTGVVDAEELTRGARRIGERAEDVEDRANADLATRCRRVAHARVQRLGEQEADTALVDAARHVLRAQGDVRRRAPPARPRCPAAEDTARLPCLATGTPAPATTNAVVVEMLKVWRPSPPVPHVSMYSVDAGLTCAARSRIARAKPTISSTVSPFMRSPTTSALIWAGVASPSMICPMTACASSSESERPSVTRASASADVRRPQWPLPRGAPRPRQLPRPGRSRTLCRCTAPRPRRPGSSRVSSCPRGSARSRGGTARRRRACPRVGSP